MVLRDGSRSRSGRSLHWLRPSLTGGEPTFASSVSNGQVAPQADGSNLAKDSAAGGVGGDQSVRRPPKQRGRLSGFKDLRADECAIDEHRELTGEFIGSGGIQPFGDTLQAPTQFALVCLGDLTRGMVRIWKLSGDVDLGATPIVWLAGPFADPIELRVEFPSGVVCVLFRDAIPLAPEIQICALQERSNKIVFSAEVAVEAGLGDPGLLDHEVNADGPDTLFVEEVRGRLENFVTDVSTATASVIGCALRHT